ncbi:type II secretion system F family protein [Photobacterium iliopiscarium]|uniref:type II secretion system F family protein n=1 Tax=Photobacterium iliopiscarium TaxID=56192 RepID=UPI0005D37463|nr:type II secretion system F family protein [Photobacterium iliopiscarium]KJG12901.1 MSHA biogenesis protein MshG [Photobacterium iliopiscarium]PST98785.1 type II secretion system F family protein [Photobacterium iliopiscarium]PSV81552.1 type II secretion system F family protein [Photobacterium iliopiscarium]
MKRFNYRGRGAQGTILRGQVEALTQSAATDQLLRQGIIPLEIKLATHHRPSLTLDGLWQRPLPIEVLVIFCRQLYSLTKAGVPLLRAFKGLEQSASHLLLRSTLAEVTTELTNGHSLSAAMQQHPRVFSDLFVSMIHVGENTGRLDQTLLQLANYYQQEMDTRRQIKSAIRYPMFVMIAIGLAMIVLNTQVIPQFAGMFARFGVDLPWPTQVLISTSNLFVYYWPLMVIGIGAMWVGVRLWRNTPQGQQRWDLWRLKIPIIGSIINRALMARFSRTFALMIRAGVPLNQALKMAAEALDNRFLEQRLLDMKLGIESGSSIATTAANTDIFTPLVLQMIAVGEETGQIDELLLDAADFYDREVDYDLATLTARIEPLLLVVVSAMVLLLALGIFLPMWGMLDVANAG